MEVKALIDKEENIFELDTIDKIQNQSKIDYVFKTDGNPDLRIEFCYDTEKQSIDNLKFSDSILTSEKEIREQIELYIKEQSESEKSGLEPEDSDESIKEKKPYNPKEIHIRNDRWQISYIYDLMAKYNEIDLHPDYQRNFIWDYKRKCRLIESLMLGIPIPTFYLSENEDKTYQVVDGLQRLSTIKEFLDNDLKLNYLEYLKDQEGSYYKIEENKEKKFIKKKQIKREYERNLLQTQINVNIIESRSPYEVKLDVFRRLNTGGKPLTNQEIRNAVSLPKTREIISSLVDSIEFKKATLDSIKTSRMEAHELALRFICFWMERNKDKEKWNYKGDMQKYLDNSIERINADKNFPVQDILTAFKKSMENAEYLFGEYAFRKCLPEHLKHKNQKAKKQLINKSLFTVLSVLLCEYDLDKIQSKFQPVDFENILAEHIENHLEKDNDEEYPLLTCLSHKTNDKKILSITFSILDKLLNQHLGACK